MSDTTSPDVPDTKAECVGCGPSTPQPRPGMRGGLMWSIELCPACTQRMAAKAVWKITKRFLREQLDL